MRLGLIYKLSCNDHYIIGSTINSLRERIWGYKSKLQKGVQLNPYLQRVYDKYGWKSFKAEILQDNIPEDILENVEDIYIGSLNSRVEDKKGGMNMRDAFRVRMSKETIEKLKESMKASLKYKEAMMKKLGVPRTMESRLKQSRTIQEKIKNGDSNFSDLCVENRFKKLKRKVIQRDLKGNFIKMWESAADACRFLGKEGVGNRSISAVCRGRENSYLGFKWEYGEPSKTKKG